jgi:multisubunit Na+/H+ antiporter MnhF subunit
MRPFCLNHWPSEGYVIDIAVVILLLSFGVEVYT